MEPYNPSGQNNVEELANRLDQMNVETDMENLYYDNSDSNSDRRLESQDSGDSGSYLYDNQEHRMSVEEENIKPEARKQQDDGDILIVTNLDPNVFSDQLMKAKFESLFTCYDERVTIRYLKSFRRVRLDFSNSKCAQVARDKLNNYRLGSTAFKCFIAQIIRPNYDNQTRDNQDQRIQRVHGPETDDDDDGACSSDEGSHYYEQQQQYPSQRRENYIKKGYLNIPKLTRQFLISPPMSPPEDWKPKEESDPCIDVQLLAAIANLVPGQTHELHAGNDSQPGIVVEVCEEPYFDTMTKLSCRNRLPKTTIPGTPRPEPSQAENHNELSLGP